MSPLNFRTTLLLAVIGGASFPATALAQQQQNLTSPATCGYGYLYTLGTPIPDAYFTSESFACPGPGGGDVRSAYATGQNSTAIGARANAIGDGSTALGHAARASAASSIAIGRAAAVEATATGSIALGAGSIATQPNTVSVGTPGSERRISNVAAGTSATDAVNVSQLSDFALSEFNLRQTDQRDTRQGIAAAIAMGSAPMPSAPGRTSYVMNVSTFRGEQAVGGSLMYRLPTAETMGVTAGFSFGGNKNNAAKVGVAGEF